VICFRAQAGCGKRPEGQLGKGVSPLSRPRPSNVGRLRAFRPGIVVGTRGSVRRTTAGERASSRAGLFTEDWGGGPKDFAFGGGLEEEVTDSYAHWPDMNSHVQLAAHEGTGGRGVVE